MNICFWFIKRCTTRSNFRWYLVTCGQRKTWVFSGIAQIANHDGRPFPAPACWTRCQFKISLVNMTNRIFVSPFWNACCVTRRYATWQNCPRSSVCFKTTYLDFFMSFAVVQAEKVLLQAETGKVCKFSSKSLNAFYIFICSIRSLNAIRYSGTKRV